MFIHWAGSGIGLLSVVDSHYWGRHLFRITPVEKEERSRGQSLIVFAPEPGYFLPLPLLQHLRQSGTPLYEGYQFRKQSYRNRLFILSSTGIQSLSVPLQHPISGIRYKEIKIAYTELWQRRHLRAIATAYGKSPYFFYWRTELEDLYRQQPVYLFEWNRLCLQLQSRMCRIPLPEFLDSAPEALRYEAFMPQLPEVQPYLQTFHDRLGFQPGVSGLDLGLNGE
jgi:hypothetical protein